MNLEYILYSFNLGRVFVMVLFEMFQLLAVYSVFKSYLQFDIYFFFPSKINTHMLGDPVFI